MLAFTDLDTPPTHAHTGYLPPPTVPPDEGGSGQTSGSGYTDYDDSEPGDDEYYESGHESGYSDDDSVNSDNEPGYSDDDSVNSDSESGYYDDNSVYPEEDSVNYSGETQDFAQGDDKMSTTKQEHTQEGEKAKFF